MTTRNGGALQEAPRFHAVKHDNRGKTPQKRDSHDLSKRPLTSNLVGLHV